MNEQISALAGQAGYLPDMFGVGHWDSPEFKKFSELMVCECIRVLERHAAFAAHPEAYHYAAHLIEHHFGLNQ